MGGAALQACVAESVDRVAGLEGLAGGAGGGDLVVLDEDGDRVAGALDVEVGGGQVAGGRVQVFAVVDHGAGAGRAEVGEREPAGGVLAEVGDPGAALQPGERAAGQVLDVAHGRGRGPVDRGCRHGVDEDWKHRPLSREEVGDLTVHQVGAGDGAGGGGVQFSSVRTI